MHLLRSLFKAVLKEAKQAFVRFHSEPEYVLGQSKLIFIVTNSVTKLKNDKNYANNQYKRELMPLIIR